MSALEKFNPGSPNNLKISEPISEQQRFPFMVESHPLILSLRSAGLRDVDPCNIDEVHNMWQAFSKAKNCIDGGDRYEYLSWRIYSREVLLRKRSSLAIESDYDDLKPMDSVGANAEDAVSDPENPTSSSSESDWESEDDENTSESDTGSENSDVRPGPDAKKSSASLPNCFDRKSQADQLREHRRISSTELQSLFNEACNLDPSKKDQCAQQTTKSQTPTPIDLPKSALKSCMRKASSTSPSELHSLHKTRFASPQLGERRTDYRTSARSSSVDESKSSSSIVRGFSPSNVSVRVSTNKQEPSHEPIGEESENEEHEEEDEEQPKDKSSSSNSGKMFYICAADSDTESSSLGSPDMVARRTRKPAKQIQQQQQQQQQQSQRSHLGDDLKKASSQALTDEPSQAGHAPSADTSDWDDISEDEEDAEETDVEERNKDMFKERAVPTKPLLKRSLLSTLFVNQVKNTARQAPPPPSEDSDREYTGSPVLAPVNILLGAPVAPHFPLPVEQCMEPAETCEWSGANIIGGGIMGQREQEQHEHYISELQDNCIGGSHANANTTSTASKGFINPRNASQPLTAPNRPADDDRNNNFSVESGWANQHEDIYDPMNYHSRGW